MLGYAALLTVASLPDDLGLTALQPLHRAAHGLLRPIGLRFSHEVFPGQVGLRHPHRWALRVVGLDAAGGRRVLEEWPTGLETGTPWLGEDPIDTVLYRALGKSRWADVSLAVGTEDEAGAWAAAQKSYGARRVMRWFCGSPRFQVDGQGPAGVRLEVFASHRTWRSRTERHGRGTLGAMACAGGPAPAPIAPPDPPSWYRGP